MNRHQYKQKRRAWRCLRWQLYKEESRYSYEERLRKEKEFKLYAVYPQGEAVSIMYLWERAKYAISAGVDKQKVLKWVKFYIRNNTTKNGRLSINRAYPCYWNNPPEI